ncbi:MAG: KEOPS complex kinase/ATPase Bud32 [Nanoarchaeota archaeon]
MAKKLIAQGAESKIFLEKGVIIKDRFPKMYRIKEIDEKLRRLRTKRETKILQKLQIINFPAPKVIKSDEKESIIISRIKGKLVKDILEQLDYKKWCGEIGKKLAILHNNLIIHGDLTTSNMILNKKIYFIDFGLSFFSEKAEDKAVDLHLLKEALESKHYKIWEGCFKCALDAYRKDAKNSGATLKRLDTVEKRGRYRAKKRN